MIKVIIFSIICVIKYIQLIIISDEGLGLLHHVQLVSDDCCGLPLDIQLVVLCVKYNVLLHFGIVCLNRGVSVMRVSAGPLKWMFVTSCIPALVGCMPELSTLLALRFASKSALGNPMIGALASITILLQRRGASLVVCVAGNPAGKG